MAPATSKTSTKRMPAKMRLIDMLLQQEADTTLKRYIVRARTQTKTSPAKTWDQIAHEIWNLTGEPLVRETVINYARAFGIEPLRTMTPAEAYATEAADAIAEAQAQAEDEDVVSA